jgi:senataxin
VKEAQVRTWLTLDALQILAYDGDEAAPYKAWTLERLNRLMSTCDVCVRVYHQSKADWKNKLMECVARTLREEMPAD